MTRNAGFVFVLAAALLPVPRLFGTAPAAAYQEAAAEAEEAEQVPLAIIPPEYQYTPGGRRDPFVDPVPPPPPEAGPGPPVIPDVRPPGLPGVLLNEAQLMGVVTSTESAMNVVLIRAPGNRTFIARPGDELLDVIVKEIQSDAVVFEVKPLEGQDEEEPEEVVRQLNAAPGE